MKLWNYNDIAIFMSVAEQHSFTAAGKKLGLPKSTVSRRISQLEDQLNIRLLERSSRKLTMTPKGKRLFNDNKGLFEQLNQNFQRLTDNLDEMSGIIKITSPVLMANTLLNKMLIDFQNIHPKI
ncbi:MAG: LysR family transcriptional regulator, partial [Rhizobiales bacterium]|nr:LysR family transcriptional regulator [Hyphomicrobiales bacterium]